MHRRCTTTTSSGDACSQTNLTSQFVLARELGAADGRARSGQDHLHRVDVQLPGRDQRRPGYTASKSGVAGLVRALANEWAPHGVNVNAIAPGLHRDRQHAGRCGTTRTRSRAILERIPAGRWGEPADLAGATVFLASAASDYVHGIVLPVDGGWLGR